MNQRQQMPYSVVGRGAHAIVFVHGFLDGSAVWEDVIARLDPALEAMKVAVDLAGMGAHFHDHGPFTLDRYAEDVAALVTELDRPVVLVGQSMGTQVVELVARMLPDAVRGLVLLNPIPLGGVHAPEPAMAPFKSLAGDAAAQRQARSQLSFAMTPRALDRLGALGISLSKETIGAIVDAWNHGHPAGKEPSVYGGPVLLVRGAADGFVDAALAAATAARFPRVEEVTVAEAGHWVHVERPDEIARLVSLFVAKHSAIAGTRASDWRGAFAAKETTAFTDAFADDVVLEAVTLRRPVIGRTAVGHVMAAASKIYESLIFGAQATNGAKQYIEWEARAFGGIQILGVTILTRDETGKIAHAAIHHRPLGAALRFSTALGDALIPRGVLDRDHVFSKES